MSEVKTDSVVNVSGDNDSGIDLSTNDVVAIKTADSERLRVDASGNVGIGETSPLGTVHIRTSDASITSVNANADDLIVENNGNCGMSICSSTSGEGNINFIDSGDTNIGRIQYTHSNNQMDFRTNDAVRFRIGSSGDMFFNQLTTSSPGQGNNTFGAVISDTGRVFSSADGTYALGLNRSDSGELTNFSRAGTFKGSISISTSAVAYNTTSDHRLKENVSDMTGAITRLKTLQPKRFNFIADPDDTIVDGFLAHEVTAVPEAVMGTHNATDSDNNPIYQQIDQSKLVPLLVGALQEAIAKIETLETKVTALENA